jgi:DNA repair protein RadC
MSAIKKLTITPASLLQEKKQRLAISQWADDDKPREKLMNLGERSITDTELLAIIIGNGTRDKSAIDLAKELYVLSEQNIWTLSKFSLSKMCEVKGIGKAKAISIKAALELGHRLLKKLDHQSALITNCDDLFELLQPYFTNLTYEEFWIVCVDKAQRLIYKERIYKGLDNFVAVDLKAIATTIVNTKAKGFFVAHNHPSGRLIPSDQDIRITKSIKELALLLGVTFLDHMIFGHQNYYSFKQEDNLI